MKCVARREERSMPQEADWGSILPLLPQSRDCWGRSAPGPCPHVTTHPPTPPSPTHAMNLLLTVINTASTLLNSLLISTLQKLCR